MASGLGPEYIPKPQATGHTVVFSVPILYKGGLIYNPLEKKTMHPYRTHHCNQLRKTHVGQQVRLSGWVHRKRDHGELVFIDLRDHFGLTQLVFDTGRIPADANWNVDTVAHVKYESVITVTGKVLARSEAAINPNMETGEIEIEVTTFHLESAVTHEHLPVQVNTDKESPEATRLKYRFLDLRREKLHNNLILRSKVMSWLRGRMIQDGFMEFQTPILTASSPEGARDYLVPSRVHPGKFYALPQAPQQFKQLLMVSGFDRYFQLAPCFRDEDARADRSPGEFYQLDIEMSYVTQDDVFAAVEPVLRDCFTHFAKKENGGKGWKVSTEKFPHITYDDAMLYYGCDKPDLRNPIRIADVTDIFRGAGFALFASQIEKGAIVRAIPAPGAAAKGRPFFDKKNDWAREEGFAGLGYIIFSETEGAKGPIAKQLKPEELEKIKQVCGIKDGDGLFFSMNTDHHKAAILAGKARIVVGQELDLLEKDIFKFCWVVDFPYYEWDEDNKKIEFSHNPFSMPQGGLEALQKNAGNKEALLSMKAFQYDIVCNGIELSSGAIRNHKPELMYKAFEIAGYPNDVVNERFGGMIRAFQYGAPPHGGIAPGFDRIVMMLADEPNIREIIAFPMNQQAEDLLMGAPAEVDEKQLRELNIQLSPAAKKAIAERKEARNTAEAAA